MTKSEEIAILRLALEDAKTCSRELGAEVDRLRAKSKGQITREEYETAFNEGYDEAKESYVAELERLRAEKAELETLSAECLMLFLVTRTDDGGYDTFNSFVCAAKNEEMARLTHPYGHLKWDGNHWVGHGGGGTYNDDTWAPLDKITVKHIGTAKKEIKGVICCTSFQAG